MSTEIQELSSNNLEAVKELVSEMFSPETVKVVEQALKNPLLGEFPDVSPGEVAIKDGKPTAFRLGILRRLYFGQNPILGVVGSTLCSKKTTGGVLLLSMLRQNTASRGGSEIFFTNTSCKASGRLNAAVGVNGTGPEDCAVDHVAVIRPISTLLYLIRKKFKIGLRQLRLPSQDVHFNDNVEGYDIIQDKQLNIEEIDAFWSRYIKTNKGLVCSRSGAEVIWMFGEQINNGSIVMLKAIKNDTLVGYIMLKFDSQGAVRIMDIIALENNHSIINALLSASYKYIKKNTTHFLLKIAGYPTGHKEVFEKFFKYNRPFGYNPCLYKFENGHEIDFDKMVSADSWFFGPYDGDLAMG